MTSERSLFKVAGMYCFNCKPIVEKQLKDERGVKNIDIDHTTDSIIVDYDPILITKEQINKKLGKSGYNFVRTEMLQHYNRRDELSLSDMLSVATSTVEMTGVSFTLLCRSETLLCRSYYTEVTDAIDRGIRFTFLILDPSSKYVHILNNLYHPGEALKNEIEEAITHLCDLRKKYPDNVIVRTYDSLPRYNITVIDRENSDNAWIRIERHRNGLGTDPSNRLSDAAYQKYELDFFSQSVNEYDRLLKRSKIYDCPPATFSV